jgi:hypothetical protein
MDLQNACMQSKEYRIAVDTFDDLEVWIVCRSKRVFVICPVKLTGLQ